MHIHARVPTKFIEKNNYVKMAGPGVAGGGVKGVGMGWVGGVRGGKEAGCGPLRPLGVYGPEAGGPEGPM